MQKIFLQILLRYATIVLSILHSRRFLMKVLAAVFAFRLLLMGDMGYTPAPEEIPFSEPEQVTVTIHSENPSETDKYQLSFDLPENWEWFGSGSITTGDIPFREAGKFAIERSETFPIYSPELFQGYFYGIPAEQSSGILTNGLSYISFSSSVTVEGPQLTASPYRSGKQYYYNILLPDNKNYAKIVFTLYEEDPDDYFTTHLQPLLDSIEIISLD
ncbi:MAG: hypothetical protein E7579_00575 [Ruminococcaceae bacterium]|nr:hypothetical protein [Oscillospiraceae bacterium]